MGNEQLILDVISRKNTTYLPSQIEFSDRNKKMQVANFVGINDEEEFNKYLGNHIRWTAHLDDVPVHELKNQKMMDAAVKAGRVTINKETNRVIDGWGMEFDIDASGFFNFAHPLKGLDDNPEMLDTYSAPKVTDFDELFAEAEKDLKKYSGDSLVMVSGYNGIWERAYNIVEIEDFMYLLSAEPELVHRFLDIITDYKVEIAKQTVKRGFKVGHHGDDLGTQVSTLFSRNMFVEYFKPRFKRIFEVYNNAGIPVQLHSCGAITPFIPDLIDIGLDILEPVQTCMDLSYLKKEYGKDLIFYGGVDTQDLLAFGSPQRVKDETLKTIEILGKGGGYICGPSQEIMDNVTPENVVALVEAITEARG